MRTKSGEVNEAHQGGICQQGIVGSEGDWPGEDEQNNNDERDSSPSELTEIIDGHKVRVMID